MQRRSLVLMLALILGLLGVLDASAQVTVSGSGSTKVVPNDPTTGTVLNGPAKVTATGAIRTSTTDANVPSWIVTGGQGTSQAVPAVMAISGDVGCIMDQTLSNTRGMLVVVSPTANGQCHPLPVTTPPSTGYVIGTVADNTTTAGSPALVSAQLINFQAGSGTGTGTVTSVNLGVPTGFTSSGGPISTSGTLNLGLATENAHLAWLGPLTGAAAVPTWRALDLTDLPAGVMTSCNGGSGDLAGTPPNCTVTQASGLFALPGDISQSVLADMNDYTGCDGYTICRINGNTADRLLTGIQHGTDGRILQVCNNGTSNKITLVAEQNTTASVPGNRLTSRANISLRPNDCKPLWYDTSINRWRPWDTGLLDPYLVRTCDIPWGSKDPSTPPVSVTDDVVNTCLNNTGFDWVITAVSVFTNGGAPQFLPTLTGQAANSILTGGTPCTATPNALAGCTVSGAPVVHSLGKDGVTCPGGGPCSIDGNFANTNPDPNFTYGYIHIVGFLQ